MTFGRITHITHLLMCIGTCACATTTTRGATHTYFIDCAGGRDANTGTSITEAWQHHPYMRGWSGRYSHEPGDRFIFKGGVTCPASYFTLNITSGGIAGENDYYGVDKGWFVAENWSRPIFDLQGSAPSGANAAVLVSASYVTLDNLEIRNLFIPKSTTFEASSVAIVYQHDVLITNALIHDWKTDSPTDDQMGGVTTVGSANITVDHSTIFGKRNEPGTMGACTFNVDVVQFSNLYDCSTGVFGGANIHDNSIHDIGPSSDAAYHENAAEVGGAGAVFVYNNLIYNCNHGTCLYPNPGNGANLETTLYIYNNVIYNSVISNIEVDMWGETGATSTMYVYNNTLVCPEGNCIRIVPPADGNIPLTNLVVRNNHYISDGVLTECWNNAGGNSSCGPVSNVLLTSNNVATTTARAAAEGYTPQTHYGPGTSTAHTVRAGANLSSSCTAAGPSLCFETSLGSNRVPVARSLGGAWGVGAFESGVGNPPSADNAH